MAASNWLEYYNPLYDVHLRQYFAMPHMQKHLRSLGLIDRNGMLTEQREENNDNDEVYKRHQAMMDMMLKNRESKLQKLIDLQRRLNAAEKVEICRRIRSGVTSPEGIRRGPLTRSLSRGKPKKRSVSATAPHDARRHHSDEENEADDNQVLAKVEEALKAEPDTVNIANTYERLASAVGKYRYLHKLDDGTLSSYADQLRRNIDRIERFREVSFGPFSVARHQPESNNSWFFRRRSLPSLVDENPSSDQTHGSPFRRRSLPSLVDENPPSDQTHGTRATSRKLDTSQDSRATFPPVQKRRRRSVEGAQRLPPIAPKTKSTTISAAPTVPVLPKLTIANKPMVTEKRKATTSSKSRDDQRMKPLRVNGNNSSTNFTNKPIMNEQKQQQPPSTEPKKVVRGKSGKAMLPAIAGVTAATAVAATATVLTTKAEDEQEEEKERLRSGQLEETTERGKEESESPTSKFHDDLDDHEARSSPRSANHDELDDHEPRSSPRSKIHAELDDHEPRSSPRSEIHDELDDHEPRSSPRTAIHDELDDHEPRSSPRSAIHDELDDHEASIEHDTQQRFENEQHEEGRVEPDEPRPASIEQEDHHHDHHIDPLEEAETASDHGHHDHHTHHHETVQSDADEEEEEQRAQHQQDVNHVESEEPVGAIVEDDHQQDEEEEEHIQRAQHQQDVNYVEPEETEEPVEAIVEDNHQQDEEKEEAENDHHSTVEVDSKLAKDEQQDRNVHYEQEASIETEQEDMATVEDEQDEIEEEPISENSVIHVPQTEMNNRDESLSHDYDHQDHHDHQGHHDHQDHQDHHETSSIHESDHFTRQQHTPSTPTEHHYQHETETDHVEEEDSPRPQSNHHQQENEEQHIHPVSSPSQLSSQEQVEGHQSVHDKKREDEDDEDKEDEDEDKEDQDDDRLGSIETRNEHAHLEHENNAQYSIHQPFEQDELADQVEQPQEEEEHSIEHQPEDKQEDDQQQEQAVQQDEEAIENLEEQLVEVQSIHDHHRLNNGFHDQHNNGHHPSHDQHHNGHHPSHDQHHNGHHPSHDQHVEENWSGSPLEPPQHSDSLVDVQPGTPLPSSINGNQHGENLVDVQPGSPFPSSINGNKATPVDEDIVNEEGESLADSDDQLEHQHGHLDHD